MVKGVSLRKEKVYAASNVQTAQGRADVRWVLSLYCLRIQWETNRTVATRFMEDFRYSIDLMPWGENLHGDQRGVIDRCPD